MDVKETELLRGNVADHWYYRSKARAVERADVVLQIGGKVPLG